MIILLTVYILGVFLLFAEAIWFEVTGGPWYWKYELPCILLWPYYLARTIGEIIMILWRSR